MQTGEWRRQRGVSALFCAAAAAAMAPNADGFSGAGPALGRPSPPPRQSPRPGPGGGHVLWRAAASESKVGHGCRGHTFRVPSHEEHRRVWERAGLGDRLARVFDDVLPEELLRACTKEAALFDVVAGDDRSYFYAMGDGSGEEPAPRFAIEAALHLLFARVLRGGEAVDGSEMSNVVGGEWWVQKRELSDSIDMHFDKDEGLLASSNVYRFPPLSTVTYLRGDGAPTLILNQTLPLGDAHPQGVRCRPLLPGNGFISYPKPNRHLVFRGDTQHGVAAQLAPQTGRQSLTSQRITLLVNWWIQRPPTAPNCVHVTEAEAKAAQVLDARGQPVCISSRTLADLSSAARLSGAAREKQDLAGGSHVSRVAVDDAIPERVRAKLQVAGEDLLWIDLPLDLAPARCYDVTWGQGSIFGNICRLLPQHLTRVQNGEDGEEGLVGALRSDRECGKVFVFVGKGDERSVLEWLRPLASEFARCVNSVTELGGGDNDAARSCGTGTPTPCLRFVIARPSSVRKIVGVFAGHYSSPVLADASALWVGPSTGHKDKGAPQGSGSSVHVMDGPLTSSGLMEFVRLHAFSCL